MEENAGGKHLMDSILTANKSVGKVLWGRFWCVEDSDEEHFEVCGSCNKFAGIIFPDDTKAEKRRGKRKMCSCRRRWPAFSFFERILTPGYTREGRLPLTPEKVFTPRTARTDHLQSIPT